MKSKGTFWILIFISSTTFGQLKSTKYGLDMMLRDIPKDQLISDIKFEDGIDDTVSVIRFDHVGPNLYPLLISSKLPVPTDSLGLLSFKLQPDTLNKFLWTVDHVNPKPQTRNMDNILIRVTYRFHGRLEQYYVTNYKITTGYFMTIEKLLKSKRLVTWDKYVFKCPPLRKHKRWQQGLKKYLTIGQRRTIDFSLFQIPLSDNAEKNDT
jgi:hypothetical protein